HLAVIVCPTAWHCCQCARKMALNYSGKMSSGFRAAKSGWSPLSRRSLDEANGHALVAMAYALGDEDDTKPGEVGAEVIQVDLQLVSCPARVARRRNGYVLAFTVNRT